MGIVMKQFIDKFKAMEKVANETLAANPEALVGIDSLPGAEHDAKVPEEAKKPNAEVAQGQPAGATTAAGAVSGGDAKPLNEGKLEMDQALTNPEKKPLITDDALTAKTANARLTGLVNDLLADIKAGTQKQAAAQKQDDAKKQAAAKKQESAEGAQKQAGTEQKAKITLDDETISKLAAAQATFMMGRAAAEEALNNEAEKKAAARNLIKAACIKAAQEQGLDPAAAEAAAENAMAAAGAAPADAAADAGADAGAGAADATAQLPDDVTEEELATAIVDLVSSGELDPDTAKALVEEIAGDSGEGAPSEDQAAEIIAQGIESGEITPEQAQEIAAAIEGGADADAGAAAEAGAAAADAEAQGAADAEAAIQDAKDEAQGAADAEAAMKVAAAAIRSATIEKVASAIVAKRNQVKQAEAQPKPGDKIMSKVASIIGAKQAAKAQEKTAEEKKEDEYMAGFRKKAEAMGVDPSALAKYVLANQAK